MFGGLGERCTVSGCVDQEVGDRRGDGEAGLDFDPQGQLGQE